ncbi:hypothetical protein [Ferrovibrio sp.]|uniref:hypothetical protein n=1 Tax=Ferrovibrio sp. TaxID=1917215 RepID=UPI0025B7B164|nr:hypothetical protein [Ferrovibrio sp.]
MKHVAILVFSLMVSACSPTMIGNEKSVVINTGLSLSPDKDAFEAANNYCAARGGNATLLSKNSNDGDYIFRCGN